MVIALDSIWGDCRRLRCFLGKTHGNVLEVPKHHRRLEKLEYMYTVGSPCLVLISHSA